MKLLVILCKFFVSKTKGEVEDIFELDLLVGFSLNLDRICF
jgi:hypothetical protein